MTRMFFNAKDAREFLKVEGFKKIHADAYMAANGYMATVADCGSRGVYVTIV